MTSSFQNSLLFRAAASIVLFICLTSNAYSQLSTNDVSITFSIKTDSLNLDPYGNYPVMDVMEVHTTISDINLLSEITVVVYEGGTDFPLDKVRMTKQELIDNNLINGNVVTTSLIGNDPALSFTINTQVQNTEGINLPIVVTNYNL